MEIYFSLVTWLSTACPQAYPEVKFLVRRLYNSCFSEPQNFATATQANEQISALTKGKLQFIPLPTKDVNKIIKRRFPTLMSTGPKSTKEEYLASMIAEAFHDEEQVNLYLIYCKKYPDDIIHRAFAAARDFPEEKIRKSRAAIFFYLIKRYAHEDRTNFSY